MSLSCLVYHVLHCKWYLQISIDYPFTLCLTCSFLAWGFLKQSVRSDVLRSVLLLHLHTVLSDFFVLSTQILHYEFMLSKLFFCLLAVPQAYTTTSLTPEMTWKKQLKRMVVFSKTESLWSWPGYHHFSKSWSLFLDSRVMNKHAPSVNSG